MPGMAPMGGIIIPIMPMPPIYCISMFIIFLW